MQERPVSEIQSDPSKDAIASFWGDTCKQWYSNHKNLDEKTLRSELLSLEDLFKIREHLAVVEMDLNSLKGKLVLDIGSGAGGHAALYRSHGASVIAVDYTPERVDCTAHKLKLLDSVPGYGKAMRADAENLPFEDNSFDIVHSNGVLHHTPDTSKAISEVLRVLKPGGQAAIMLYSRHSLYFWLNLVPNAILDFSIFKYPEHEWVGRLTEGKPKFQSEKNPYTRVYSRKEILREFSKFKNVSVRKHSFSFKDLPFPGTHRVRKAVLKVMGYKAHTGGYLVHGESVFPETKFEQALARFAGFAWNISATK
jgi:ubiquinone/menaquinone biosynthesis C-methylase UbiE